MLSSISATRTLDLPAAGTESTRQRETLNKAGGQAYPLALSRTEQVHNLREQGELDVQIAAQLNLSTKEVDTDMDVVIRWPQTLALVAAGSSTSNTGL